MWHHICSNFQLERMYFQIQFRFEHTDKFSEANQNHIRNFSHSKAIPGWQEKSNVGGGQAGVDMWSEIKPVTKVRFVITAPKRSLQKAIRSPIHFN